jgi:hypothetical protein
MESPGVCVEAEPLEMVSLVVCLHGAVVEMGAHGPVESEITDEQLVRTLGRLQDDEDENDLADPQSGRSLWKNGWVTDGFLHRLAICRRS